MMKREMTPDNVKGERVLLGLGSNQFNRLNALRDAIQEISRQTKLNAISSVYETEPWGDSQGSDYLNMAAEVFTDLPPEELLKKLLEIEKKLGRVRRRKWEPRIIDLDILFYGNLVVDSAELKIPHPHLSERRFALEPLAEIAPDFVNPVNGKTMRDLLRDCPDQGKVNKLEHLSILATD